MTAKRTAEVIEGEQVSLAQAVAQLLPETGSVEVQRDTPARAHDTHTHPEDETLLIVSGSIKFKAGTLENWCTSGDRLLLPARTEHSSVAGDGGCVYVIALETAR